MTRALVLTLLLSLAGCAPAAIPTVGKIGGVIAKDYVQVVSISRDLAEIEATGRLVRLPAPPGLCAARDGLMTGANSAFVLMEPCGAAAPGLLSVSIGAGPLSRGDDYAALVELEAELGREDELGRLGFDAGSGAVFLKASEIRGGALYLTLEDRGSGGPAFAGRHLARAFAEFNGRLAVVTLISLRAQPLNGEDLTEALVEIVEGWSAANAPVG